MITSPSLSAVRSSKHSSSGRDIGGSSSLSLSSAADLAWQNGHSGNTTSCTKPFFHSVPPSDPLRQANRLPIKVLKMLTARTGHILHPEYLQPLPSTPVSPIELDAKKSPLALLAQTCSQIGKPDPSPSSKLSSVTSNGAGGDKDSKSGPLKLSDIGVEDKSSFKPYSKPGAEKKEPGPAGCGGAASGGVSSGEKSGFRVPSATCQPFTPRTGSPNSSASACSPGLLPAEGKAGEDKKDAEGCGKGGSASSDGGPGAASLSHSRISVSCGGINVEGGQHPEGAPGSKPISSDSSSCSSSTTATSSASVLGSGLVAPVSPYKPGQTVFPLPPAGMSYPGTLAGAYAGYPPQFLPHGVALDPTKSGSLVGAQLAAAGSLGCSKPAGSSPLAGASPPSVMTASLCRDPYCLSYHCASHLAGAASASCAHDQALKSGYPLVYPTHPLHSVHSSLTGATPPSLAGHPLYPYGFMLPNDPQPHICNWVSANGPCDKRFATSEELLSHLRTHTAFPGTDKLLSSYPSSSSLASAAAAAMACHMHIPTTGAPGSPGTLALRSPHHALGLSSRYHPYSKSPLPTPGAPVPVPAATGPYYSPYALYGQRLTTASALGYQ
ncbi:zinc finger protein 503-like [Terrapene carolina triunguis]|uniref:Zinc finger protein 503 n=1 Tax=Terrapene triunguis TaxID=2587831 RepID=A0A674IS45_9SAUR|nr:zinc finger protein 503 [Terrapene carolina triunguis]XP_026509566.1 zinc finger protein 503-like [Terrapene carolina triunguis]